MVDREISAGAVVAYLLWVISLAVWSASWILHLPPLGHLAIIVCGAAATATVRTYFVEQSRRVKSALALTTAIRESGSVHLLHQ